MSDPGGADVSRELSEAECLTVTADIDGGRSICAGARVTGRDGAEQTKTGSSSPGKRWLPAGLRC